MACGLLGTFLIDTADPVATCAEGADIGDLVEIGVGADSGAVVHIGAYAVPAELGADCTLSATSCVDSESSSRYVQATLELNATRTGIRGWFESMVLESHRLDDCDGRTDFTAAPKAACEMRGTFQAAAATVTSGACDYGWPAGSLVITESAGSYVVSWNGIDFDPAALDAGSCSLTATLGIDTAYVFNGVPRSLTVALTLAGDVLSGTVTDELTGTSDFGETCNATFAMTATRGQATEMELPRGCAVEIPYVCGDGACDTAKGEGCRGCISDCPCATDQQCLDNGDTLGVCGKPCSPWTEAADCAAGERCDFLENRPFYSQYSTGACSPAGALGAGERCVENAECQAALYCHKAVALPGDYGVCSARCSPQGQDDDAVPCASPTECAQDMNAATGYFGGCQIPCDAAVDGSCPAANTFCWKPYSNEGGQCAALPEGGLGEFGEACNYDPERALVPVCAAGLSCHGFNCASTPCEGRCTKSCSTPDECPASIPACDSFIGVCSPPLPT
jgi:hypothetical protein